MELLKPFLNEGRQSWFKISRMFIKDMDKIKDSKIKRYIFLAISSRRSVHLIFGCLFMWNLAHKRCFLSVNSAL